MSCTRSFFFLTHGYNHSQIFVPVLFISPQFLRSKITINRTPMALWGRGYFYFYLAQLRELVLLFVPLICAAPVFVCRPDYHFFIRRDFTAAIQILPQSMLFWKQWAAIFNHICAPIFNPTKKWHPRWWFAIVFESWYFISDHQDKPFYLSDNQNPSPISVCLLWSSA